MVWHMQDLQKRLLEHTSQNSKLHNYENFQIYLTHDKANSENAIHEFFKFVL